MCRKTYKKTKEEKRKYANCSEEQSARYRGCLVAKTYQESRNKIVQQYWKRIHPN